MRPTPTRMPDGMASARRRSRALRRHPPRLHAGGRRSASSGSFRIRHTLAEMGAARLWHLLKTEPYVNTLGALTGNQAVQQVKAGLKAIYLSGWQVAADANTAGQMYPDQSLYPVDSVPNVVRADQRRAAPRRPDRAQRRLARRHLLDGADRGRRRGRVRRRR